MAEQALFDDKIFYKNNVSQTVVTRKCDFRGGKSCLTYYFQYSVTSLTSNLNIPSPHVFKYSQRQAIEK